jgi:DNA-binding CsgD family transcriptional regulator
MRYLRSGPPGFGGYNTLICYRFLCAVAQMTGGRPVEDRWKTGGRPVETLSHMILRMKTDIDALNLIATAVCTVNEHGRITAWNHYAELMFRLPSSSAIGREWHTIVRSLNMQSCCALCQTRHALRAGAAVRPLTSTLVVDGRQQHVILVPLPGERSIDFLILTQELEIASQAVEKFPISISSRVRHVSDDRMIDELTMRERDILACVVDGLDARSIAVKLGISHATARNYVQRILTKLGVRNKAEAVSVALTYNLLAC